MSEYDDLLRKYVTADLSYNNSANYVLNPTTYGGSFTAYPTTTQEKSNMNLKTKVVELKAGFVGQVLHLGDYMTVGTIVWESKPKKSLDKANKAADKAKARAVARLFEEN